MVVERFVDVHPVIAQLPPVPEAKVTALAEEIARDGLKKPITLLHGRVWDGRARRRACAIAGVKPLYWVLKNEDPIEFLIQRNPYMGEPHSDLRRQMLEIVRRIRQDAFAIEEQKRRSAWISQARQESRLLTPHPQPCEVCGKHLEFVHAHHVLPLALQYDIGLDEADQTHSWLCPTHHKIVHVFINIYLFESRSGEVLDRIPDRFQTEWLAAEGIFRKGADLFRKYAAVSPFEGYWLNTHL